MKAARFSIDISGQALDDLQRRLIATRWPRDPDNASGAYGFKSGQLKSLVDYWANEYSWQEAQERMNRFDHYKVEIDGIPIHFIHKKGRGESPIPLVMSAGWPSTFWEMHRVIDALADPQSSGGEAIDAFDVIVPSLPGFGFSSPINKSGLNATKVTELLHRLMTEVLGYTTYAASGGDWGSRMVSQLGHQYASSLYGIHLLGSTPIDLFNHERFWDLTANFVPYDTPAEIRKVILPAVSHAVSHACVQSLEPQTLSYAMHDSPVGQLAWLMQRYQDWGDTGGDVTSAFDLDYLLTTASLFWLTETFETSVRYYRDAALYPWFPSHNRSPRIEAPTGITFLGGENPPGVSTENRVQLFMDSAQSADYNLSFVNAHEHGGHFGYYENPQACIDDIRATFRTLRP